MGLVSESSIMTWFSKLKQTNYLTPTVAGGAYRRLGETSKVLFDVAPTFENDTENNGSDEPTGSFITTNIFSETALPTYFSFQDIVYWLQMIMGVLVSGGSASPRTHTIAALNKQTARQHPVRTFGQREGSNILIYPSIGLKELRIAKNAAGRLTVSITPHGGGVVLLNPASYAVPSVVSDRVYGYNNQASHSINDLVASLTKGYQCEVQSWEWVFTNSSVDDGFRDCSPEFEAGNPAGGQTRAEWLTAVYDWKFNCTVRYDSSDPVRTILRNGHPVTIQTEVISTEVMDDEDETPYSLTLTDENGKIERVGKGMETNGFITQDIGISLKASKDDGLMTTQAVVVNDVAGAQYAT